MLKDILSQLLHQDAPSLPPMLQQVQERQRSPDRPGALSDALRLHQNLPMDNLDGTYSDQPVGTAVFKEGAWFAPLKPQLSYSGDNLARFDPLNSTKQRSDRYFPGTFYPVLPINPSIVPKTAEHLPYMGGM